MTPNDVAHLKELVNEKIAAMDKSWSLRESAQKEALRLQAKEYERRLEMLNGEQARIAQIQMSSISRELYENDRKNDEVLRTEVRRFMAEFKGGHDTLTAVIATAISVFGLIMAMLALYMSMGK